MTSGAALKAKPPGLQEQGAREQTYKVADMTVAYSPSHGLGEEQSIWYKLTPLLNQENPMQVLMALSDKYGGVIPISLKNQRIVLLSEPAHAERVLVSNADNYTKYFDGLRPVFGRSMITIDGALWQKIRSPQQAAFHPNMFEAYFPYLMSAIDSKMARWAQFAQTGETIEMVEETWTLAAEMVCKALFDREMPFNPHFVFGQVKTYTDVMNHKSIRLKNVRGELEEMTQEEAAKAMEVWGSIPDTVIGANVLEQREKTLLKMLEAAEADPEFPGIRPPPGDRRDEAISVGRHRDHGADARLVALPLVDASRGARAHQGRGEVGLRRARSRMERGTEPHLHAHGHPGDHAAVPADLGSDQDRRRRRRDRRPPNQGRRQGGDPRLRDASQPEILGRAREVRSRAFRARACARSG